MQTMSKFAALTLAVSFLLLRSPSAEALTFAIGADASVSGENAEFTATSTWISLSDHFDQYSETLWEIATVEEQSDGRIYVTYNYPNGYGPWDSTGALINIPFQIHSGNLTPEPVNVEVWGASFYQSLHINTCCFSDSPVVQILGVGPVPIEFSATQNLFDPFSGTITLVTNSDYTLTYFNVQYVEGTPSSNFLPEYFGSWDQYNTFVDSNGTSGTVSASASGFFDFNMALVPIRVPEPSTLALFGLGLAGLGFSRRRRLNGATRSTASHDDT